jgi:VanZ family protein
MTSDRKMMHYLNPPPRSKQRLWLWLWLVYWLGLFILMHVPVSGLRRLSFNNADKIIHFVLYFLLTYLGGRYLSAIGRARSTMSLIGYACMYAAYGAFDEWLQQYTHRTMDLYDWLTDAAGITLATLLLALQRRSNAVPDPSRRV